VERFPPIEPFESGMLEVGDGQRVHWEASGNPGGRPALVVHGGPGSGSTPGRRRLFDPAAYLIVQFDQRGCGFDQRGCGRSTPHAGDPATDLSANTTHHLVADMERLREHLGVKRWLLWGGSWGCTLALAYAERHPERVSALVLASVTMTRPADIHWLYHEVGRYFPEQDELLSNEKGWQPNPRHEDPAFRMAFTRIVTHYFHHGAWLADDQLLRDAGRLAGIPGVLVATGHVGGGEMTRRTLEATNRFARLGR
jgi:proline iminopeptidase